VLLVVVVGGGVNEERPTNVPEPATGRNTLPSVMLTAPFVCELLFGAE
jgi:hypothetical protein